MSLLRARCLRALMLLSLSLPLPSLAADEPQVLVHLLGYIGVDYPETVAEGQVTDAAEYAEQQEFAGRVITLVGRLAERPAKSALTQQAKQLEKLIQQRAVAAQVTALTEAMRASIVSAYGVVVAPRRPPDLTRAAALYQEHCGACHGAGGRGDGPLAANLDPRPNDFHDRARQAQRSIAALYNTISLGVDGTAMPAFRQLSDAERWALAFHIANYYANDSERQRGAALYSQVDKKLRYDDIAALTQTTPAQAAAQDADGAAVLAHLRAYPELLFTQRETPLAFSARTIKESLEKYRDGQAEQAYELAISAYLEGFELAESGLAAVDARLKTQIETQMLEFRQLIKQRAELDAVGAQAEAVAALLGQARAILESATLSPGMALGSSFIILLREGMEAILLLAAIIAFLVKTDRRATLRYVHAGWIIALALGLVTWWLASYVIAVSGASREITEGVAALLAAGILFYIGVWLHSKLQAQRWKEFIDTRVERALSGRTAWALVLVSFIAVYREVFETVLFYQALWVQAGEPGQDMVLAGFGLAAVVLAVLGWGIFRFSLHLPLRPFFAVNSALLYILAVIFAGKGVAALQEAGRLPVNSIDFPRIDVLGIYPNVQTLGLQATLILIAVIFVVVNRRAAVSAST